MLRLIGVYVLFALSRILCQALHLNDVPEPQRGILLDLYTNMVLFCRQQKFSKEQTSVLLSNVKNMHQLNTGDIINTNVCIGFKLGKGQLGK